jgi:hypothetical protein
MRLLSLRSISCFDSLHAPSSQALPSQGNQPSRPDGLDARAFIAQLLAKAAASGRTTDRAPWHRRTQGVGGLSANALAQTAASMRAHAIELEAAAGRALVGRTAAARLALSLVLSNVIG